MDFEQLIQALIEAQGEDADITPYTDLRTAHGEAISTLTTGADAQVAELNTQLAEQAAMIQKLQAENYVLIKAQGVEDTESDDEESDDDDEDNNDESWMEDDGTNDPFADLFEDKEK